MDQTSHQAEATPTPRSPRVPRAARLRVAARRAAAWASIVVAAVCAGLWLGGLFVSVGRYVVTNDTSLRFRQGVVDVEQVYDHDFAAPVPAPQWREVASINGWAAPRLPSPSIPTFWYSGGGHVVGLGDLKHIRPARYRVLRVPLWPLMLPGLIVAVARVREWRRRRRDSRRQGFPVHVEPPLAHAVAAAPGE
jgi:hypothetical protein